MRVYAPGRVLTTSYMSGGYNILPLEGGWIDIPDYFRQATRNKPVNDVVHAKIVEPVTDQPMTVWDSTLTSWPYKGQKFCEVMPRSSLIGRAHTFNCTPWSTVKRVALLEPSPSYKGKNPRIRYGNVVDRHLKAWTAVFRWSSATRDDYGVNCKPYRIMTQLRVDFYILREGTIPYKWDGAACSRGDVRHYQASCRSRWLSVAEGCQYAWEGPGGFLMEGVLSNRDFTFDPSGTDVTWYYQMAQKIAEHIHSLGSKVWDVLNAQSPTSLPTNFKFATCEYDPIPTLELRSSFLLGEPETVGEGIDPILLGAQGGLQGYWRNLSTQHALKMACESLPRLSDNSIQNLTEIASFIKALVVDHRIEIPKSLADAWLSYRYQYGTGKMDINDAIKFVSRRRDLGTLDREISSYGRYSFDYEDTSITCCCSVGVKPKDVGTLKRVWRALDTYGLTPDFYVIWDSIPYSFMVDWFLPISDIASNLDADRMYLSGEYYLFDKLCYSLKYFRDVGNYRCQFYTRWAGSVPSSFNSLYWFDAPSGSAKTWGKRVLDAASIFIGR